MSSGNKHTLTTSFDNCHHLGSQHRKSCKHLKRSTDEQFSSLKACPEVLKYYKDKIVKYNKENEEMQLKVDKCKSLCEISVKVERQLQQRTKEVSTLQNCVSDLQVIIFQERENVLRLTAENDKYRIRAVEDRKKIELLLALSGTSESELAYFVQDHQNTITVRQKLPPSLQRFRDKVNVGVDFHKNGSSDESHECPQADLANLKAQSLAAQLEETTSLSRNQIAALLQDRDMCQMERDRERKYTQNKIQSLTSKLEKAQDTLCSTTKDLLKFQERHRSEEMAWIGERDKITRTLETYQDHSEEVYPSVLGYAVSGSGKTTKSDENKCTLASLKEDIRQKDKLIAHYQEECKEAEDEVVNIKDQCLQSRLLYKERTQKMAGQITYLKKKYDELDSRRRLEAQGFRNEIQLLRNRLRELEKMIAKLKVLDVSSSSQISLGERSRSQSSVMATTQASLDEAQHLESELRKIKSKVLQLEEDLADC